ncbi:MAG: hypothetical protein ACRDQW_08245 [Haloechinothrix sp.]
MKAIGRARVPMPVGQPVITEYVLEGGLWCLACQRLRCPAPAVDGTRFYACPPGCPQPPTEALPVEQDALLVAYVRATAVLHGVARPSEVLRFAAEPEHWRNNRGLQVSAEELRGWLQCPMTDRRAVLRTAYERVDIDAEGRVRLVWRHSAEATVVGR